MKIHLDRNIYSDSCISNAVYWMTDRYLVNRTIRGEEETISFEAKGVESVMDSDISFEFLQKLNDYKLRETILLQTKDIKTILYAKAFGDFDGLTEKDFEE